jgi:hypothetical protein
MAAYPQPAKADVPALSNQYPTRIASLPSSQPLSLPAREVLITVAIVARAMMVKPTLAATRPAEFGLLMRALAGEPRPCLAGPP